MAANFSKPATTDNYSTAYTPYIVDNFQALCLGLVGAAGATNIPTNSIGFSSANKRWEKYNGSAWVDNLPAGGYAISISGTAAGLSSTLAVGSGGSGATSFTSGGILVGNGSSAIGIASAAQIVAAIGATAVANATSATTAGSAATATSASYLTPRVVTHATATSIAPNSATTDIAHMTNTQAAGVFSINNPTGSPVDGQTLIIRLKCTNAQTYSWGANYRFSTDLPQPTVSSTGKTDYLGFKYNSTDSKWDCLSALAGF